MGILNDFSLEGKVALVTGASYGIGFAIATAYAVTVYRFVFIISIDRGKRVVYSKIVRCSI